ncbi:Endoplasmic reticulum mannosyl-oligosaccharide 1 [Mactra antiquata]
MMQTSRSFRDGVSINLGFDPHDSSTHKSQSWMRSWRRLSSLQRTMIILFLCIGILCFIYFGPSFQSEEPSVNRIKPRNLPHDNPMDMLSPKALHDIQMEKERIRQQHQNRIEAENAGHKPPLEAVDNPDVEEPKHQLVQPNIEEQKPDKVVEDKDNDIGNLMENDFDYFAPDRKYTTQQLAVIEAFKECWSAYKKYAWGHDEFHPVSKGNSEWFGTGLTIVDSIDTIVIMGLEKEYEEAREYVSNDLSFDVDKDVNLFEITIRELGGLLSSYHLTGDDLFKKKAIELGDRLLPCFNSPSRVPFSDVNLRTGNAHPPRWGPDSSTSEVTTIQLEFKDLSRVTGDPKYKDAVEEVYNHVHEEPKKDGLVPIFINAQTGKLRNSATISFGARGDSYYEYLLKQWLQTGKTEMKYKNDFVQAVEGMQKHLVRKSEPSKLTYIGELLSGRSFSPKMDHLVCFMGGTLALGQANGLSDDFLDLGRELTHTCYQMYFRMPTKLSPEIVYFNQASGAEEDLIVKPLDAHNLLRPETVESIFYMYRITKDEGYREWGWKIFQAFKKHCRIEGFGYSSISNVKNAGNPGFRDKLESFFLSETLKYLFLLFSDEPDLIPLDKFVINTEGHPLPIYKSAFSR